MTRLSNASRLLLYGSRTLLQVSRGAGHGQVTRRLPSLIVEHVVHPALVQQIIRRRRVVVLIVSQRLERVLDGERVGAR